MNIREILLKLSGKEITTKKLTELSKQAASDKPVHEKLGKVIQMARANKLTKFKFVIAGAFRTLLTGKKKTGGKIVPFNQKEISGLDGIDSFTYNEAQELGIIDGLGKLQHKDIYKAINAQILEFLKDDKLKFRKAWREGVKIKGVTFGPQNYVTQNPYRGFNAFAVFLHNFVNNTDHTYFMTRKQVAERGGTLKKGAAGLVVAAYIKSEKEVPNPANPSENLTKRMQGLISYRVYPLEQTEGVKPIVRKKLKASDGKDLDSIIIVPQTIIDNMPKAPKIFNQGDRAFYRSGEDVVYMPLKKAFNSMNEYYSTLFHELVHSTGNPKRIGRKFGKKFGDKDYAFEELIAELGAAYLCGVSNIEYFTLKNSAAYLKSWSSALRSEMAQDKTFFFRAIMGATKAAKYIIGETVVKQVKPVKKKAESVIKKPVSVPKPVRTKQPEQLRLFAGAKTKGLSGTMSVDDALKGKFDLLGLDGQYLKMIGEACRPTSFFIYGPGGSGKSTFTLKFAYYLAQKANKVAYVAGEQYNTPVLQKMLERLKITPNPNFTIAKDMQAINPADYDVLVLDSKDSLDIDHDNFLQLKEKYPKVTWAILSEGTKAGSWKGSETWRNRTDCLIWCENGIAYTGLDKNRWGGKGEINIY